MGASFQKADLERTYLDQASLQLANLQEANLHKAALPKANLERANLKQANLEGAFLPKANLKYANLCGAHLQGADFGGASLYAVNLQAAGLNGAILFGAELQRANLERANLERANLRSANLWGANAQMASLCDANLEGANLEVASGVRLDGCYIPGARFSPNAGDPWSVLRRNYTGPRLLFHMILLLAFLIPYSLQTLQWAAVNRVQIAFQGATRTANSIAKRLPAPPNTTPSESTTIGVEAEQRVREEVSAQLSKIAALKPCLERECQEVLIWHLMTGLNRGWGYFAITISLVLYNAIRAFLTWSVSALREEEERSGYSPRLGRWRQPEVKQGDASTTTLRLYFRRVKQVWSGYLWLYYIHVGAYVLLAINVTSLLAHAYEWLTRPVFIPKL